MTYTNPVRRLIPVALALAALAAVGACGGSSDAASSLGSTGSSGQPVADAHNSADVTFATDMIPHHAQGVEMADMALAKAADAEVRSMAEAIKGAQDPEIRTMTGWLQSWNAPVPETAAGHSMHGDAGMGMMSAEEMTALEKANGAEFDKMWVDMMVRHHDGAIQMANTEIRTGQYAAAKAFAQQIVTGQTREVARLKAIGQRLA